MLQLTLPPKNPPKSIRISHLFRHPLFPALIIRVTVQNKRFQVAHNPVFRKGKNAQHDYRIREIRGGVAHLGMQLLSTPLRLDVVRILKEHTVFTRWVRTYTWVIFNSKALERSNITATFQLSYSCVALRLNNLQHRQQLIKYSYDARKNAVRF